MTTISGRPTPSDDTSPRRIEGDQSPSEAVVEAVAAASGRDPVPAPGPGEEDDPLPPLYETISPDALDALFATEGDPERLQGEVTFTYCGYEVTVESTGRVTVTER